MQPPSIPGGAWTTTYLHEFTDGQVPGAALVGGALVMDEHGTIFGATQNVYAQPPNGTVYAISPE
ncbi:MAG TPA: hypothetical protein VMR62_11895 [Bryobacteraceae bacterium]|jgi:hypothetical protein|nr:hypothetical protein [Bryobacteraceae bacterium]